MYVYCPKCEKPNAEHADRCSTCGHLLNAPQQIPSQQPPPQQVVEKVVEKIVVQRPILDNPRNPTVMIVAVALGTLLV